MLIRLLPLLLLLTVMTSIVRKIYHHSTISKELLQYSCLVFCDDKWKEVLKHCADKPLVTIQHLLRCWVYMHCE